MLPSPDPPYYGGLWGPVPGPPSDTSDEAGCSSEARSQQSRLAETGRTEALYLADFWNGKITEEELCDMLEYFDELREQHGLGPSTILNEEALREILAGLEETRLAIVKPFAKKSAKRRQRRAQKAASARREVLFPQ